MVGDWRLIAPPMVAADVGDLRVCALDGQHPPVLEATAGAASWLASSAGPSPAGPQPGGATVRRFRQPGHVLDYLVQLAATMGP